MVKRVRGRKKIGFCAEIKRGRAVVGCTTGGKIVWTTTRKLKTLCLTDYTETKTISKEQVQRPENFEKALYDHRGYPGGVKNMRC